MWFVLGDLGTLRLLLATFSVYGVGELEDVQEQGQEERVQRVHDWEGWGEEKEFLGLFYSPMSLGPGVLGPRPEFQVLADQTSFPERVGGWAQRVMSH